MCTATGSLHSCSSIMAFPNIRVSEDLCKCWAPQLRSWRPGSALPAWSALRHGGPKLSKFLYRLDQTTFMTSLILRSILFVCHMLFAPRIAQDVAEASAQPRGDG